MEKLQRRGRGRPRRDEAEALRVRTWAMVVKRASGLSAAALDTRFYDPDGRTSRRTSGLWSKYLRGEVSPGPGVIDAVEAAYPKTAKWFRHPLWQLLCRTPSTLEEMKSYFFALGPAARELLVYEPPEYLAFWRVDDDYEETFAALPQIDPALDALAACLLLMREAEFRQNPDQLMAGCRVWPLICQHKADEWPLGEVRGKQPPILSGIHRLVYEQWKRCWLPGSQTG